MTIVKEVEMIHVEDGHNKIWIAELYNDGTVITRWGRIGHDLQCQMKAQVGEGYYLKKIEEKRRKGYAENSI
jgi:predicted DNA-binding WGR domain protein